MANVKISCRPNGPLIVEGAIELCDSAGAPVVLDPAKTTFALCRCGLSEKKPFCDGNHNRKGWKETPA